MTIGSQTGKRFLIIVLITTGLLGPACVAREPIVVTQMVYQTRMVNQPVEVPPRTQIVEVETTRIVAVEITRIIQVVATSTPTLPPTETPVPTATPIPTATPTPWPARGFSPEQEGVDSELLVTMLDYIEQGEAEFHGVLVIRNGHTVVEVTFPPYQPTMGHSTRSVGKSFTGALVGIAIGEGYIEGVDHKVLDFFPERTFANPDPRKDSMTLEHLLTMTSGMDWPESSLSYSSSRNIMNQMMQSQDWVQFVLDRPMAAAPGTVFNYSSGASHLLAAIVQESTGMSALAFARTYLFEPLGISYPIWPADPQGVIFGAGGVWITPRDMAKLGQLYLQGGVWEGQQVVPAAWVEASVARQAGAHGAAPYYGYQWWVRTNGIFAAHGYGGQRIFVIPDLDMVVVFTGELQGSAPSTLLNSYIIPAAKSPDPLPENPEGVALLDARIREIHPYLIQ